MIFEQALIIENMCTGRVDCHNEETSRLGRIRQLWASIHLDILGELNK